MINLDSLLTSRKTIDIHVSDELYPRQHTDLIRLGAESDGGYVLTQRMLSPATFLLTFGIGYDFSFEIDFAKACCPSGDLSKKGQECIIHAYDHTVFDSQKIAFLQQRANLRRYVRGKWARCYEMLSVREQFFSGSPAKHIKRKVVANQRQADEAGLKQTLEAAQSECGSNAKMLLKIDIEGSEYEVLEKLCSTCDLSRITGILCEFHEINKRREQFRQVLGSLKQDFFLIHTHMNNSAKDGTVVELTFENKNLEPPASTKAQKANYPLPRLDYPCSIQDPDFVIDFQDPLFFQSYGGILTKLKG